MDVNGLVIHQFFELSRSQYTVEHAVGRDADNCLERCDHVCAFFYAHLAIVNSDLDKMPVLAFVGMVMPLPVMRRRFHLFDFGVDEFDPALREQNLRLNLNFANDAGGRPFVDLAYQGRGNRLRFVAIPFST
ncbi:hypothetical protein Bxe_B0116 [Paraburkholderia xenovorans LB400]|uniref:Uncharacterized protein n=1 Tax=Paraburkholderia xenovorans (strain LB400) TaxID=266265 RepID=Q13JC0_PARXL|nr:hypothetical protein Bxe_B0116 [Paraburkholderia xenovorans LB400]